MPTKKGTEHDLKPNYKLWFETDGEYIFGPGACAILTAVLEEGTLTKGAERLGMSYRYAWGVIRKIERKLGTRLIETYKGGKVGGGGARVTEQGLKFIKAYSELHEAFESVLKKTGSLSL
ncbi:MAG: winged helix-turn-helix domain-containing protein [Candidatus Thorarchaeota archaeon]